MFNKLLSSLQVDRTMQKHKAIIQFHELTFSHQSQ